MPAMLSFACVDAGMAPDPLDICYDLTGLKFRAYLSNDLWP